MAHRYTEEELNELGQKAVIALFLSMQDQMERMNENMEALIEQIRISNQRQFGRKTEQLDQITGQISLFNEVELFSDADVPEADQEDMLPPKNRSHKRKGKKEEDLQGFPEEHISHPVTDEDPPRRRRNSGHRKAARSDNPEVVETGDFSLLLGLSMLWDDCKSWF